MTRMLFALIARCHFRRRDAATSRNLAALGEERGDHDEAQAPPPSGPRQMPGRRGARTARPLGPGRFVVSPGRRPARHGPGSLRTPRPLIDFAALVG